MSIEYSDCRAELVSSYIDIYRLEHMCVCVLYVCYTFCSAVICPTAVSGHITHTHSRLLSLRTFSVARSSISRVTSLSHSLARYILFLFYTATACLSFICSHFLPTYAYIHLALCCCCCYCEVYISLALYITIYIYPGGNKQPIDRPRHEGKPLLTVISE